MRLHKERMKEELKRKMAGLVKMKRRISKLILNFSYYANSSDVLLY